MEFSRTRGSQPTGGYHVTIPISLARRAFRGLSPSSSSLSNPHPRSSTPLCNEAWRSRRATQHLRERSRAHEKPRGSETYIYMRLSASILSEARSVTLNLSLLLYSQASVTNWWAFEVQHIPSQLPKADPNRGPPRGASNLTPGIKRPVKIFPDSTFKTFLSLYLLNNHDKKRRAQRQSKKAKILTLQI